MSAQMSTAMMSAPSRARRSACARPCPRAAPVISATLPSRLPMPAPSVHETRVVHADADIVSKYVSLSTGDRSGNQVQQREDDQPQQVDHVPEAGATFEQDPLGLPRLAPAG